MRFKDRRRFCDASCAFHSGPARQVAFPVLSPGNCAFKRARRLDPPQGTVSDAKLEQQPRPDVLDTVYGSL